MKHPMLLLSDGHLDKMKHKMQLCSEGHQVKKKRQNQLPSDSENGHLNKSEHKMQLISWENQKHPVKLSSKENLDKKKRTMLLTYEGHMENEKRSMQLFSERNLVKKKHLMQLSSEGNLDKSEHIFQISSGGHLEKKKHPLQLSSKGYMDKNESKSTLSSGGHLEKKKYPLASEGHQEKEKLAMKLFSEGHMEKAKHPLQLSFERHLTKKKLAMKLFSEGHMEKAKHPLQLSFERHLTKKKRPMQLSSEGHLEKKKPMHSTDNAEEIESPTEQDEAQMKIYFRLMNLIPLEVNKWDTIENVIGEVSESEGLSIKTMCFRGNWLEGEHKLVDYDVRNGSVINVFIDSEFRIQIHVMLASSKRTLTLDVDKRNTIHSIKGKIQNKEGFTASQLDLIYLGEELDDRKTVAHYNIDEGSTIYALFHVAHAMQIYINFRRNRRISLQVKSWYSGKDIKHVIESMVGIPRLEQKLYLGEVKLKNHMTMADLGIRQGQTLHLFSGTCICVETLRGKKLLFEVDRPPTTDDVLWMVQERENIPITERPRLVFYGKQLHKHMGTIADSNTENKATLSLVLPRL